MPARLIRVSCNDATRRTMERAQREFASIFGELAQGFLLTEGMIHRREDVIAVEPCAQDRGGNVVNVALVEFRAYDTLGCDVLAMVANRVAGSSARFCAAACILVQVAFLRQLLCIADLKR